MSRKSKQKVVHSDDLKMCSVDPDSENRPRNWMTEPEVTGNDIMDSGDDGGTQEADERQEEGLSLADLDVSGTKVEEGT